MTPAIPGGSASLSLTALRRKDSLARQETAQLTLPRTHMWEHPQRARAILEVHLDREPPLLDTAVLLQKAPRLVDIERVSNARELDHQQIARPAKAHQERTGAFAARGPRAVVRLVAMRPDPFRIVGRQRHVRIGDAIDIAEPELATRPRLFTMTDHHAQEIDEIALREPQCDATRRVGVAQLPRRTTQRHARIA